MKKIFLLASFLLAFAGLSFAQTTPVNRQNEFGASFGGPVILPKYDGRNRTFFYFVYDGFRYRAGATNNVSTVPTVKVRGGDFSGAIGAAVGDAKHFA